MPDQTNTQEHPERELQGADAIARLIGDLPQTPGVYRMIGKDDAVLYVGKAKSLKKRVSSYLRSSGQPIRIQRMIAATRSMEFVSTHTETEALLLEANLIKRMRPPYNVLLRDDKSFAYILLTKDHEAPAIIKHRGAKRRDGDYFGPFASAGAVNVTINALQKAFLLRNCSDAFYQNRTRPCLQHQIRRCAAPCTGEISREDYARLAAGARAFLSGKNQEVKTRLAADMEAAAAQLNYEKAALYRDRIAALSQITARQDINPLGLDQADMFALHREANHFCVQVFFFRAGQNWGNQAYFSKADADVTDGEILESLIAQFYDKRPCPQLLLVSHTLPKPALLSNALSVRSARKVAIHHPQRGGKRQLIIHGLNNAKEALARRMADRNVNKELLEKLAALLALPQIPQRIEVYDNSHLSGQNPVGAMIVAGLGGFAKRHYRKFNIRSEALTPGDDYAMLREVLERRFSRLVSRQESAPEKTGSLADDDSQNKDEMPDWPDLILIDGGRGQLNTAIEVAKKKGLEKLVLASIAKGPDRDAGREKIYCAGKSPFRLPLRDPVLFFLQRLRDEAHRFAIGAQRSRRKKSLTENPLDEIGGIGPARKKILLHHFGTMREIARAGTDDLARIPSISHQVARRIYDHFHE